MHFRTMQLQLFQKQYFKHESQSLNFLVIVHSQLPIYFQIKLLFFVFLYIKPTYLNKLTNPCVFHRCEASTFVPMRPPKEHFNDKMCLYNICRKNVTKFDISLYKNIFFSCNRCKILFNENLLLLKLRNIHCKDMTSFECLLYHVYISNYCSYTCTFIYLLLNGIM